jgi:hypothetical protein
MKIAFSAIAAVFVVGCASTAASREGVSAETTASECADYYNVSKKNSGLFVGIGKGTAHEIAVDYARADLAKEISSSISANTTVSETEHSASVTSVVDSRVSALLFDAKVSKKCEKVGQHEAVVTMHRDLFLSVLQKAAEKENEKARSLAERVRMVKGVARPSVLIEARDFLESSSFEDLSSLCTRLGGCAQLSRSDFDALEALIESPQVSEELAKANLFRAEFVNALADELSGELASVLRRRNVVLDDSAPETQIMHAECSEQFFPAIAGTDMRVLEVSCRVVGYIDHKKQWSRQYLGKGVGATIEEARSIARNQLSEIN